MSKLTAFCSSRVGLTLVRVDSKKSEFSVIVNVVFLSEHKDEAPEIADEPGVDRVIAFVGCYQDLRHHREEAFQRELLQMREELVLVNVEDLEAAQTWVLFDHLVADVHCFIISVVHAGLDVW